MLVILGTITLASTLLTGLGARAGSALWPLRVLVTAASLVLNFGLYLLAFRVLTDRQVTWTDVAPGAAVGAVLWTALQGAGSFFIQHQVKNASAVYGFFGFVLGTLTWLYLGAQVTLLAAEVNVVRKHRLWPRALTEPLSSEVERRALERSAKVEERHDRETVEVSFDTEDADAEDGGRQGPSSG